MPSRYLFALDPGVRKVGVSLFEDGGLMDAATLQSSADNMAHRIHVWILDHGLMPGVSDLDMVCERMHKRPGRSKYDKDLDSVERLRKKFAWDKTYTPTEWKGSTPKAVHQARLRKALSDQEAVLWDELGHDARDAVGIGLFHLKRVKRGGLCP